LGHYRLLTITRGRSALLRQPDLTLLAAPLRLRTSRNRCSALADASLTGPEHLLFNAHG